MYMLNNWIVLASLAGFFSNLFNFGNRYVLRGGDDATAYAWLVGTIRYFAFLLLAFLTGTAFPQVAAIPVLATLGTVEVLSAYVFMKMHAASHLSISSLIIRTRLVWVPLIAFLFLGEQLLPREYVGVLILFFGLTIAISPHKLVYDRGVKLAYLSGFIIGILTVLMKAAATVASTPVVVMAMSLPTVVIFPIFMKNSTNRLKSVLKHQGWVKVLAAGSNIVSMFFYTYALKVGPVSKVTAIYQGMLVLSVLAGIVVLGERGDVVKKLIGSVGVLFGVLLLT